MMRIFICLLVALLFSACSTRTVRPIDEIEQLEQQLKPALPKGWAIKKEGQTLKLTRSDKLWVYSPIQQDLGKTRDEWAKEVGQELTYSITLRFEPLIPREQYDKLKAERAPYAKIVDEGAGTIDEWGRAVSEFHKHVIPVYFTDRYTIYADKPDGFPERVYPDSAAAECKQVVAALDKLLKRYETWSGKDSEFQVR